MAAAHLNTCFYRPFHPAHSAHLAWQVDALRKRKKTRYSLTADGKESRKHRVADTDGDGASTRSALVSHLEKLVQQRADEVAEWRARAGR